MKKFLLILSFIVTVFVFQTFLDNAGNGFVSKNFTEQINNMSSNHSGLAESTIQKVKKKRFKKKNKKKKQIKQEGPKQKPCGC